MTDATQPRMARGSLLSAGILVAALFALLAFAPIASASPDPVGSGKTKLTLNKNWKRYLGTFGPAIKIQKLGKAKLNGRKLTMPIYEGTMDPANGLGRWKAAGGLKFKTGKRHPAIKAIELRTNGTVLVGKVAGKKMKVAKMAGWSYARNGFGVAIKVKKFKLTKNAANRLNQKTGFSKGKPKPFIAGKVIANGYSNVQPATVAILGEQTSTQLTLSKEALVKLASLPAPVKLSLIPPATLAGVSSEGTPIAAFPVTGGQIGPYAMAGTVMHSGGLKLEQNLGPAGTTTLEMGNIWLDLGAKTASVEVTISNPVTAELNLGPLGRASIADIDLSGATIVSDPVNRKVTVQNGYATLQAVTAATLNQVFAEPVKAGEVFKAGDPLGHFSFTVPTQ